MLPEFAEAIRQKLNGLQRGELLFSNVHIVSFLHCKIDDKLGTTPLKNEGLAERHPGAEIIQRALYSGYSKMHKLKVLTVVFPNGIIAYLYCPVSAQENNIGLLNLSWLNKHLVALQLEVAAAPANGENILFFSMYGDKIFSCLQCITHTHEPLLGGQLHPRQRLEVPVMNSLRTSVEWPYGDIMLLFQVMQCKHLFLSTVLVTMTLHQQLCVIFFTCNCYVCFYGDNFTKFFDLPSPSLANYLEN